MGKRGFHVLSRGRVSWDHREDRGGLKWLFTSLVSLLFHWPSLVKAVLPDGSSAGRLPGEPHVADLWMCRNFVCRLISKVRFLNFFLHSLYICMKRRKGGGRKKYWTLSKPGSKIEWAVFIAHIADMFQVWAAFKVSPLCQLKPFMKGIWMHRLVVSRHPSV